jgi:hypothetical protein
VVTVVRETASCFNTLSAGHISSLLHHDIHSGAGMRQARRIGNKHVENEIKRHQHQTLVVNTLMTEKTIIWQQTLCDGDPHTILVQNRQKVKRFLPCDRM